jgi:hypothetical protein
MPSPKQRLSAVYTVPDKPLPRSERVIYQLEDTGHPVLRLRPTVRVVEHDGIPRYLYRVDAFSRLTGKRLGSQETEAAPNSPADFAAASHQFQSAPFREVIDELSGRLADRFGEAEAIATDAIPAGGGGGGPS